MDVGKGFLNFTRIICCSCSIIYVRSCSRHYQYLFQTHSLKIHSFDLSASHHGNLLFCNFVGIFFYLKVLFSFCGVFKKKKKTLLMFSFFVPVRLVKINITNFFYCMIKWSLIEMTYFVCWEVVSGVIIWWNTQAMSRV